MENEESFAELQQNLGKLKETRAVLVAQQKAGQAEIKTLKDYLESKGVDVDNLEKEERRLRDLLEKEMNLLRLGIKSFSDEMAKSHGDEDDLAIE